MIAAKNLLIITSSFLTSAIPQPFWYLPKYASANYLALSDLTSKDPPPLACVDRQRTCFSSGRSNGFSEPNMLQFILAGCGNFS